MNKQIFNKRSTLRWKHFSHKGYSLFSCLGLKFWSARWASPPWLMPRRKASAPNRWRLPTVWGIQWNSTGGDYRLPSAAWLRTVGENRVCHHARRYSSCVGRKISNDDFEISHGRGCPSARSFGVLTDISPSTEGTFDQLPFYWMASTSTVLDWSQRFRLPQLLLLTLAHRNREGLRRVFRFVGFQRCHQHRDQIRYQDWWYAPIWKAARSARSAEARVATFVAENLHQQVSGGYQRWWRYRWRLPASATDSIRATGRLAISIWTGRLASPQRLWSEPFYSAKFPNQYEGTRRYRIGGGRNPRTSLRPHLPPPSTGTATTTISNWYAVAEGSQQGRKLS